MRGATAVRWVLGVVWLGWAGTAHSQFVAINEEVRGANTSASVTTNDVRLGAPNSGLLKNLTNGANTSVLLTLTNYAAGAPSLTIGSLSGVPRDASPASNVFGPSVTFGNGYIALTTNQVLAHVLAGLDPDNLYSLKGTTIKGTAASANSDRWTLFELAGAASFTNAHSPGCLTNGLGGIVMAANQVAICTGDNREGRIFDWEGVRPTAEGTLVIYSKRFYNVQSIPGVITNTFTAPGYGLEVLRVEEFSSGGCSPARFAGQPQAVTGWLGDPASLVAIGAGTVPLSYQWYQALTPTGASNPIVGATSATYALASAALSDIGYYTVVVSNACGSSASTTVGLNLWTNPPVILNPATNVAVPEGNTAQFFVTVYGTTPMFYRWYKDGVAISGAVGIISAVTNTVVTNTTSHPVLNVSDPDAGFYTMVVTNRVGAVTNGATLSITDQPVVIQQQPQDLLVSRDDPATFTVLATGGNLRYQWYKGQAPPNVIPNATNATYTIPSTVLADAGSYSVVISNASGALSSRVARLAVTADPPSLIIQPTNLTVAVDTPATFSVVATGAAPLVYQWYKNEALLPNATNLSYLLPSAALSNAGFYRVTVTNRFGTASSSNASLSVVYEPVVITNQPQDVTVVQRDNAGFSVGATGSQLRYQWFYGDSLLVNATNPTLILNNVLVGQSGYYQAVVWNPVSTNWSRSALLGVARPLVALLATNALWSYEETGADLGTNWYGPSYPAAEAWPTGVGVFGFRGNETGADPELPRGFFLQTFLHRTNLNTAGLSITNAYFRTTFNFDHGLMGPGMAITVSNLVDDGAVVYLNGKEVWRVGLPTGAPDFMTFANRTVGAPKVWESFTVPVSQLLPGTNVVAAEVHQINPTSVDLTWMSWWTLSYVPPSPLTLTNQPASLSVPEAQTARFAAGVGAPAQPFWADYQWYKVVAGLPQAIATATAQTLEITNARLGVDDGDYFVTVSNPVSYLVSQMAHLEVLADTTPPRLVSADGSGSATSLLLTFSEGIVPASATDLAHYALRASTGESVAVLAAVQTSSTTVLLTTAARSAGLNWLVVVNGLRDLSPRGNAIVADSTLPVATLLKLGALDQLWTFANPVPGLNDTNLGTAWRELNFIPNPNDWGQGHAPFGLSGQGAEQYPWPLNTCLTHGVSRACFRSLFDFPGSPAGARLLAKVYVDDAAVVYLNGVEVARTNLASGELSATNLSRVTNSQPLLLSLDESAALALQAGPNVLAVDVRSSGSPDNDLFFAAELAAQIESLATGPVQIVAGPASQTVVENDPVTFAVHSVGASQLQWFRDGAPVVGATNATLTLPYVPLSLDGSQFHLTAWTGSNQAVSTNATLTVLAQTKAPALFSAYALTNTPGLLVSFTRPVDPVSATTLANYAVTNSAGPANDLVVTGAAVQDRTNVVLTLEGYRPGAWVLMVNHVRAASSAWTPLLPNGAAVVGLPEMTLLDMDDVNQFWRYQQQGLEPAGAWEAIAYDDRSWSNGLAAFDGKWDSNYGTHVSRATVNGVSIRSHLMITGPNGSTFLSASYFRGRFAPPVPLAGASMNLYHFIDDGAVFYLNGQEVGRFQMASGAVDYSTLASGTVGDASLQGPMVIAGVDLQPTNLFAAEVHQINLTSTDLDFGVKLTCSKASQVLGVPPMPPQVVFTGSPTGVGASVATLHGTVNPNSFAPTKVWFEWGPAASYGSTTLAGQGLTGLSPLAVTTPLSNLLANTSYQFRLVASNCLGVVSGSNVVFTTVQ